MAQAEYIGTSVSRLESAPSLSYSGGYIFASYFLTNDTRKYDHKDAEFGRVVPSSTSGAWEVAARFSTVDMNDDTIDEGGEAGDNSYGGSKSFTFGVNYYPNPNVKLMLNYGIVDNDEFATGDDNEFTADYDFSYLQMRFQTAF
jgi:phosphate-selective porin OprO/OprP